MASSGDGKEAGRIIIVGLKRLLQLYDYDICNDVLKMTSRDADMRVIV